MLDSDDKSVVVEDIILPCGCIDIVLQKESVLHAKLFDNISVMLPRFSIGPQGTSGFTLCMRGKVKIFGIRLLPHAIKSVFGFSPMELKSSIWSVQQVFSIDYAPLAEELMNNACIHDAIRMANAFFLKKLPFFLPLDFMVKNVCNSILTAKGDIKLPDIFHKYKETTQTLRNRFLKQVGICPKEFISIARFQYAISLFNQNPCTRSLTDIALSAGYYDQAHFIRKFKQIVGLAPRQYHKQQHHISRFFMSSQSFSFVLNFIVNDIPQRRESDKVFS